MVTTVEDALLAEQSRRAPKFSGSAGTHQPRVAAPFFAGAGDGPTLHRYLDDDFVARFLNDAHAGRLAGMAAQPWFGADRFGRFKNEPTLRLPMHRSFYVVCAEVQCAIPGAPAFDPNKILGAGMVVRRMPADGPPQRWMIADGQPLGWRGGPIPDHDPDDVHRLTARGLLPQRFPSRPIRARRSRRCTRCWYAAATPAASCAATRCCGAICRWAAARAKPPMRRCRRPRARMCRTSAANIAGRSAAWTPGHGAQQMANSSRTALRPRVSSNCCRR